MILHLGDDVSVHSADIVAIIDLTQSQNPVTGAMLAEIRRQNRILARQGVVHLHAADDTTNVPM